MWWMDLLSFNLKIMNMRREKSLLGGIESGIGFGRRFGPLTGDGDMMLRRDTPLFLLCWFCSLVYCTGQCCSVWKFTSMRW